MTVQKERQLDFRTLQAWKMKFFDFMTFQVFLDLYKPCGYFSLTCNKSSSLVAHDCLAQNAEEFSDTSDIC